MVLCNQKVPILLNFPPKKLIFAPPPPWHSEEYSPMQGAALIIHRDTGYWVKHHISQCQSHPWPVLEPTLESI